MRNTYKKPKPFFMVYAEGGNTPAVKHETLESAEKDADRLSNKLGVSCYVLQAHEEYEPMKPIEVEKHKPKRPCWFQWRKDKKEENIALFAKIKEECGDWDSPLVSTAWLQDGDIIYTYNGKIEKIAPLTQVAMMIKMFGTELRIKEE